MTMLENRMILPHADDDLTVEPRVGPQSAPATVDWVDCIAYGVPDDEGDYICHFTDGTIETFTYHYGDVDWWERPVGHKLNRITHWAALPNPPGVMMLKGQAS